MRTCINCGAHLDDDALFCTECGTKVEAQGKVCPNCGAKVDDGSVFCSECGTKIEVVVASYVNEQQPQEQMNIQQVDQSVEEFKDNNINESQPLLSEEIRGRDEIITAPSDAKSKISFVIGIAVLVLLIIGGVFVYKNYFGAKPSTEKAFPKVIKYVVISVPATPLYSSPSSDSPVILEDNGNTRMLGEGHILLVLDEIGEWYKVATTGPCNAEYFIRKDKCWDYTAEEYAIPDIKACYLMLFPEMMDCAFVSYNADGKKYVVLHEILPSGKECLKLGTYNNGHFVFYYMIDLPENSFSEYRYKINVKGTEYNLIAVNEIPEDKIWELFEKNIKSGQKWCQYMGRLHLEDLYVETTLEQAQYINGLYNGHYNFDGVIGGKYKYNMRLNVAGNSISGAYSVDSDPVDLKGSIDEKGNFELTEYYRFTDTPTKYYFEGRLSKNIISGKYKSHENKKLNMSFSGKSHL